MPATDPSPARSAADEAFAQAATFVEKAVRAWHSEDDAATVSAAAQISIAFALLANLEQLRAWEAES